VKKTKIKLFALLLASFTFVSLRCTNLSNHKFSVWTWKNHTVNYTFENKFNRSEKILIELAMYEWEKACNIKFINMKKITPCSSNYLVIEKNMEITNHNYATIGSSIVRSSMTLSIFDYEVALHELGHVLGLQHEHCRPDRDRYIEILHDNIVEGYESNFRKESPSSFLYPYTLFKYDYSSIMHYREYTFSKNGKPTIKSNNRVGSNNRMGVHSSLSKIDIQKVRFIYGAPIR